jgi:hypothetical protein
MNQELFDKFRELDLPIGGYAIFGSGPMAIRGLRESSDIDFIVPKKIFDKYRDNEEWKQGIFADGTEYLSSGDMEMLYDWGTGWDTEELIKNAEIIDGLAFVRLKEVLKWKKMRNKEKDQKDIEIIENYLSNK